MGGNETLSVNVRVIAATNQNLETMIESGKFRRDLYYRLRGVVLHLPALRDRVEDIAEWAHYFLFRYNRQLGTSVQSISAETLDRFDRYKWPGDVRELQSVIREALIASNGTTLLPEFLPNELQCEESDVVDALTILEDCARVTWQGLAEYIEHAFQEKPSGLYRRALLQFDRLIVAKAMKDSEGHQTRAAEILGISRPTLRTKLRMIKSESSI